MDDIEQQIPHLLENGITWLSAGDAMGCATVAGLILVGIRRRIRRTSCRNAGELILRVSRWMVVVNAVVFGWALLWLRPQFFFPSSNAERSVCFTWMARFLVPLQLTCCIALVGFVVGPLFSVEKSRDKSSQPPPAN